MDQLDVDQIARPALELVQRMGAGKQHLKAGAVLYQVAQHAQDSVFVETAVFHRRGQHLKLIQHQQRHLVRQGHLQLIQPLIKAGKRVQLQLGPAERRNSQQALPPRRPGHAAGNIV